MLLAILIIIKKQHLDKKKHNVVCSNSHTIKQRQCEFDKKVK